MEEPLRRAKAPGGGGKHQALLGVWPRSVPAPERLGTRLQAAARPSAGFSLAPRPRAGINHSVFPGTVSGTQRPFIPFLSVPRTELAAPVTRLG